MMSLALKFSFVAAAAAIKVHVNSTMSHLLDSEKAPCACVANNKAWQKTSRTTPKCIFIDLGAADGNTFDEFIADGFGPVRNCPSGGQWEAFLVEANPIFSQKLGAIQRNLKDQVHSLAETAAFSCTGTTSFFIDTDKKHNYWGSSMFASAPDAARSGHKKVTVPTINVAQLIAENTIPEDYVILKVDIESAEYRVIPCLAEFNDARLVDQILLEEHSWFPSVTAEDKAVMAASKKKLKNIGISMPRYFSPTF